ncbi:MAG: DUF86 domain-containing protein [Thermoplasmata archaeon]
MSKDDTVYLKHILDALQRIEEYTQGVSYECFQKSNLIQAGVIRELEIVGEATKRLSENTRMRYPHIPWNKMARMRDKLIHGYFGVDLDAVWDTVKKDVPLLKTMLVEILEKENK